MILFSLWVEVISRLFSFVEGLPPGFFNKFINLNDFNKYFSMKSIVFLTVHFLKREALYDKGRSVSQNTRPSIINLDIIELILKFAG